MTKKKIAHIANKMWTDESFKREFMKELRGGATTEGSLNVTENITEKDKGIGTISASKCGAGSSCTNYGTICSATTN